MKLYNSYIKKTENKVIEDIILVKNGFSFPAFFFNILWFFYKKMWKESIIILLLNLLVIEITEKVVSGNIESLIIIIGYSIIIGLNANHLYAKHLKSKDYQFCGYVFGKNNEAAKLRFIHNFSKEGGSGNIFSGSIFDIKKKKGGEEADYFTI